MWATLAIIGGLIAAGSAGIAGYNAGTSTVDRNELIDTLEKSGYQPQDIDRMLGQAFAEGYLDSNDYQRSLDLFNAIEQDALKKGEKFSWAKTFNGLAQLDTRKAYNLQALYHGLTNYINDKSVNGLTYDDFIEKLKNDGADAAVQYAAPAAPYLDEEFRTNQMQVDPLKIWSAQELADYHDLNYDPNYYYDLIKQGADAGVNLANAQNEQARTAALMSDETTMDSYLSSLRNSRAEAVANGTTSGAQAANELLASLGAMQNYSDTLNNVSTNAINNLSNYEDAAASARLNAENYFKQLANNLIGDSTKYYASDVGYRGQQLLTNSGMYEADMNELNSRIAANAAMNASYVQAAAAANAANQRASSYTNQYKRILDSAMTHYDNNFNRALLWTNDVLGHQYQDKTAKDNYLNNATYYKN